MIRIINGDCTKEIKKIKTEKQMIVITDPPFNVGYHYNTYKDRMDENGYYNMLKMLFADNPFVIIHYPESIYRLCVEIGRVPTKVVSWIYNSNTAKQHRDIAFFDVKPDFNLVRQPYKNPNDKRVKQLIANGKWGGRLYDWWNVNQVKNVSKNKTEHPCQMPQEVMDNIIGILPDKENVVIVDPFMGSGTTGLACKKYEVDFIGIEMDEKYFEIAKNRLNDYSYQFSIQDYNLTNQN